MRNSGGWRFIDSTAHNKQRVSGGQVEFIVVLGIHGNDVQKRWAGSFQGMDPRDTSKVHPSHSVLSVSVFG